MKITRTMKYKIKNNSKSLKQTIDKYRGAVSFLVKVYSTEWDSISVLNGKERQNFAEKLIHKTKDNPDPVYDFGAEYYKFPSYFRRSAIAEALGIISSHKSNYANWQKEKSASEDEGLDFDKKPPALSHNHFTFPVFYKGNMSKRLSDKLVSLKLWNGSDWIWEEFKVSAKDKGMKDFKELNPSLVKRGKRFFLHFPYETKVELKEAKLKDGVIVAVDLGLTNSAVCAAMKSDGTVTCRKFINQPVEKDRLWRRLCRLKKAQIKSCTNSNNSLPNYWRKINNINQHIAQDTANQIVDFAKKVGAGVIVFEYLDDFKKPKGKASWKMKQRARLQHWMHKRVVEMTGRRAHRNGMRYRRVSARNTSKLAFDGSGEVTRNNKQDLAVFKTGKVYHADLNAAYNIGARYYIRELLKTFSEKKRSQLEAKVPHVAVRTKCTLATLIRLCEVM